MRKLWLALGTSIAAISVLAGVGLPAGSHPSPAMAAVARRHASVSTERSTTPRPPRGTPEFSATFSGSQLNTKVWAKCYPWQDTPVGCTNYGANDKEWYLPSQVRVYSRLLHLVAQRLPTKGLALSGKPEEFGCRSGMISSYPSFHFEYGFVQVVAKIPHDPGLWPALWLAAANKQPVPEIDMIEVRGVNTTTAAFFHPVSGHGRHFVMAPIPRNLTTSWQTYTLIWTKSELAFYVGGKAVLRVTKEVPHQAMYFLADLASYQAAVKPNCNGQLLIRSVKVWKA
jgi:beta-glucanase (GH16 family)